MLYFPPGNAALQGAAHAVENLLGYAKAGIDFLFGPLASPEIGGTSFAIARVGAVISLSCGAILNLGICRYAGKGQGEVSLLRRLWDVLRPGDVLLGDRLMSGWAGLHLLKQVNQRFFLL